MLASDWDCVLAHWRRELLNRCTVKSCTQGSNPCLSANESYECKSLCQKDLEFSPFPPKFGDSSQGISAFHTRESPQVELCPGEILHSGNEEYRSAMEPVRREV